MNMDQLRRELPDEHTCRVFFESIRWPTGHICPHCGYTISYKFADRPDHKGRYECKHCHRQFTVTTKTALHSTKLALWKRLQAMYLIVSSSKGISSVILARLIGVTQPTAWRMGHSIRQMMDPQRTDPPLLQCIVKLDEAYVGGQPVQ